MSKDSSSEIDGGEARKLSWTPLMAVIVAAFSFIVAQMASGLLVAFYANVRFGALAESWVKTSTFAQFLYIMIAELATIGLIWAFLRYKKTPWAKFVGLSRPHWVDAGYAVVGFLCYWGMLIFATILVSAVFHINTNQEQAVGFSKDVGGGDLVLAFAGLAVLPPLAEEILFRGFFFGTLRKYANFAFSAIATSIVFGILHLFTSAGGGLLWIAAVDTFILSMVLCYLREKTGNLWASIAVHAMKNSLAFLLLFILKKG
jgi:uncharacterized protein